MRRFLLCFFIGTALTFIFNSVSAQAPIITYNSPTNIYTVGTAIAPLTPTNTGGAVPVATYAKVTTLFPKAGGLSNPKAVTSDGAGNVYVADYANNVVRKVTAAGVMTTLAGSGAAAELDGTGAAAKLNGPAGIVYDGAGNLYVADRKGQTIRKIVIATGAVTTYAGIAGSAGTTNSTLLASKFKNPAGLDIDASTGNMFICDQGNNTIRMISAGNVNTLAGLAGTAGATNGIGVGAKFNSPIDLVADGSGNVFVADNSNSLIRKIVISTGLVSTFAGSAAGYLDATGAAAKFNRPTSISIDALGNLYVADGSNNRIRLITPAAVVTTIAGSGANSEVDGTGIAATFSSPAGIDIDGLGNCYIVDFPTATTGSVRKMSVVGYSISAAPPAGITFTATTGTFSGTPTVISAATNYTITGYNLSGNSRTIVSIAVGVSNAWTAGSNTQVWATAGNWSAGIPTVNDAVSIGVNAYTNAQEPIITTAVTVGSVTFGNTGGNHTLTVTSPGSLTISSYLTVNNGVRPTLTGTGNVNISPGATVNITGTGVLTTNLTGTLTLKSDATGSASVGPILTTSVTGTGADSIHVERYLTGGAGYRGYRLLSSPVYVATVGTNNVCGLNYLSNNIYLTGAAGGGFNKTGNPTIYLFREDQSVNNQTFTTGNFWGISAMNNVPSYNYFTNGGSTITNIPVGNGYMVFFRGDRSAALVGAETVATYVPTAATLSAYGTLNTGQIVVHDWYTTGSANLGWTNVTANGPVRGFNLVGNPYASSIDWEQYSTTLPNTTGIYVNNVGNTVYELNPLTNNYDSYQVGGAFTNHGSRTIVSGQAFYVIATAATAQLIFNESAKASAPYTQNTGLNLFMATKTIVESLNNAAVNQHLRLQLAKDAVNTDDTYIGFSSTAKPEYVYNEDAPYNTGSGQVSLASISSDNIPLAINMLPLPKQSETIKLTVGATTDGTYKLNMLEIKAVPLLYDIWLMDAYKKDSLDMRHSSTYAFDIYKSDTNSYGSNRFSLVIRQNPAIALRLLSFTVTRATGGAQITWTTQNEQNYTNFTIERSTDNGKIFDVLSGFLSTASGTYGYLDRNTKMGLNQYRLKLEDVNGAITYSNVESLLYANSGNDAISVYPNPTTGTLNLVINQNINTSSYALSGLQTFETSLLSGNQSTNPQSYDINIISIDGAIVRSAKSSQASWQGNLSGLQPGTYIIQVLNDSNKSLIGKSTFVKL